MYNKIANCTMLSRHEGPAFKFVVGIQGKDISDGAKLILAVTWQLMRITCRFLSGLLTSGEGGKQLEEKDVISGRTPRSATRRRRSARSTPSPVARAAAAVEPRWSTRRR